MQATLLVHGQVTLTKYIFSSGRKLLKKKGMLEGLKRQRSSFQMCSIKKAVLKDLVHRKKPVLETLFNKFGDLKAQNFIKRDANTGAFFQILQNL